MYLNTTDFGIVNMEINILKYNEINIVIIADVIKLHNFSPFLILFRTLSQYTLQCMRVGMITTLTRPIMRYGVRYQTISRLIRKLP